MTLDPGDPATGLYLMAKLLLRNMPSGDTHQLSHWFEAFTKMMQDNMGTGDQPISDSPADLSTTTPAGKRAQFETGTSTSSTPSTTPAV